MIHEARVRDECYVANAELVECRTIKGLVRDLIVNWPVGETYWGRRFVPPMYCDLYPAVRDVKFKDMEPAEARN